MKRVIFILILLLVSPVFAEDPKTFTDQDLGKYKTGTEESVYQYNKAVSNIRESEGKSEKSKRRAELAKEELKLLGEDIPIDDLYRKLKENQKEMDRLMEGETNPDLLANNAKSKLNLKRLCGR